MDNYSIDNKTYDVWFFKFFRETGIWNDARWEDSKVRKEKYENKFKEWMGQNHSDVRLFETDIPVMEIVSFKDETRTSPRASPPTQFYRNQAFTKGSGCVTRKRGQWDKTIIDQ